MCLVAKELLHNISGNKRSNLDSNQVSGWLKFVQQICLHGMESPSGQRHAGLREPIQKERYDKGCHPCSPHAGVRQDNLVSASGGSGRSACLFLEDEDSFGLANLLNGDLGKSTPSVNGALEFSTPDSVATL